MSTNPDELTLEFKVDGSTALPATSGTRETKHGRRIQRFHVDQRLDSPDYFSVQFMMDEGHQMVTVDQIKPGATIELFVGYGVEGTIFKGEISYIEPHFSAGENTMVISGYDFSHRMTRGTMSRTFGDGHKAEQDPGSILSTVVSESKARKGDSSDGLSAQTQNAGHKLEYIGQYNMNDYQFIQQVIGNFGLGWDAKSHANGKQVSLKPAELSGASVAKISRESKTSTVLQSISADFRLSTVRQVARVEVRGWDTKAKKPILGKAESLSATIGGTAGLSQAGKAHYGSSSAGRVLTIVDVPVGSEDEAKGVAQSILDKLGMDWMTADVVVEGRPDLHAGVVVELEGYGTRYSGKFLVEGCQHVYVAGGGAPYRCYLKLARNASPEP